MTQYHPIEKEIIEKAHFVPEKKYRKRQDYLAAVFVATTKMQDSEWQGLSESAFAWTNQVAEIWKHNKENPKSKQPIPDFNGENNAETTNPEAETTEHSVSGSGIQYCDDKSEHDSTEVVAGSEASATDTGDLGDTDQTKKAPPAPKKRGPKTKVKANPKKDKQVVRSVNQWGVTKGTKSDRACQMAARPEGTTQKEIALALGQTHYNLFNRIERRKGPGLVKVDGTRIWLLPKT